MNKKFILSQLLLFICFISFSQSNIGLIDDPDGFVNIRLHKSSKSKILGVVKKDEYFSYFPNKDSNWWPIETEKGLVGYMHKSRIKFHQKGYIHNGKLHDETLLFQIKEYDFHNLAIQIIQFKPTKTFYYFNCKSRIRIIENNQIKNEINYNEIEAVGGAHGVLAPEKQPSNQVFVLSKFGDYNGQIIVINKDGKVLTFNGGSYFITKNKKYLVSNWDSDLSGISIYNLETNKLVFEEELEEYLSDWYFHNNKYFCTVSNDIENTSKIYQLDLKNLTLLKSKLKKPIGEKITWTNNDCSCD